MILSINPCYIVWLRMENIKENKVEDSLLSWGHPKWDGHQKHGPSCTVSVLLNGSIKPAKSKEQLATVYCGSDWFRMVHFHEKIGQLEKN